MGLKTNRNTRPRHQHRNTSTENKQKNDKRKYYRSQITTRYLQEGQKGPTVSKAAKGLRTQTISSLNPDQIITPEIQNDITQQLATKQNTYIHNTWNTHRKEQKHRKNGYEIYTSAASPNPKSRTDKETTGKHLAGVSIAIREETKQPVCTISRIDERIMTITLDHEQTNTTNNISHICTTPRI